MSAKAIAKKKTFCIFGFLKEFRFFQAGTDQI